MKTLQEMTKDDFVAVFNAAGDGDLIAYNTIKKWSSEEGGYWYIANAGNCDDDCDDDDYGIICYWFENEIADENGYVPQINARI